MKYPKSYKILDEVKKASTILINCHRDPDPDSVGSALALSKALKGLGKSVKIVYPGEEILPNLEFLKGVGEIELIDFSKFDFSKFDIFLSLDSSSWAMVTGDKEIKPPPISTIVIDHHLTNEKYGKINLVDSKAAASAEILFWMFGDWGVEIDKETATYLLTGLLSDSGGFMYSQVGVDSVEVGVKLMRLGADKEEIAFHLFRSIDFKQFRFWGEIIGRMQFDEKHGFCWSAIPYERDVELGSPKGATSLFAGTLGNAIAGSNFSIFMVEHEPKQLSVNIRSRNDIDTSPIAVALGGGGHKFASGAILKGEPFQQAVEKVLEAARKYANQVKP
jgi:phosphoesterase RecJ-like protein